MTYYAIIGREDGDDEDTCFLTQAENAAAAEVEFRRMMIEAAFAREGEHPVDDDWEPTVYVNHILASTAPITIDKSPWGETTQQKIVDPSAPPV